MKLTEAAAAHAEYTALLEGLLDSIVPTLKVNADLKAGRLRGKTAGSPLPNNLLCIDEKSTQTLKAWIASWNERWIALNEMKKELEAR